MENVKKILREHYVNPEESTLIQSKLREKGIFRTPVLIKQLDQQITFRNLLPPLLIY